MNNVRQWSYTSNYGTSLYSTVPSPSEFRNAAELFQQFQSNVNTAAATFVIGGYRSIPSQSAIGGQQFPVKAAYLFTNATAITAGTNLRKVQTGYDFRSFLAAQGGMQFETVEDPADFTVITVTGLNAISSITQCRRYSTTFGPENVALYEVVMDTNPGAARNTTPGSAGRNEWAYHIGIPIIEDSWTLPAGALHFWFRYDLTWQRLEEGPCRLIFPDPYLSAGVQMAGDTVAFSRFVYLVAPTN